MKRAALVGALGLVAALAVVGCGSTNTTANSSNTATGGTSGSKQITIGLSFPAADHGWMAAVIADAQDEARAKGVNFTLTTASNPNDQVNGLQDLVSKHVNVIVMDPIDTNALTPEAGQIMNAGIPLVLFDRGIANDNYTEIVTGDNTAIGEKAAQWLAQELGGKGDVVIISGVPGDVTNARTQGFMNVIKNYPNIHVLANQSGNFTEQNAYNVMQNILQAHSHIDAVYSEDDEMSLGVLKAIQQAHRTDIKFVTGTGGDKNFYAAIKNGSYPGITLATFTYSPLMVKQAVDEAIAIASGQKPQQKDKAIPPTQVDSSNVDQYYDPNANY